MPGSDDPDTQRVKAITALICSYGWSLNDFLIAFYSSKDPSVARQRGSCLAKSDGARFAPEDLLNLWFKYCPLSSRGHLESAVMDRASKIIINEADKACNLDSLHIPMTQVEADDLDQEFLLAKLQTIYTETLPYLWLLLFTIITSWNRSEKKKGKPADCKEQRAIHVKHFATSHWHHY